MKKYELVIQTREKFYSYKGGSGTSIKGLNIDFSIPHYDDASHVNLPTTITLFNADIELYFKNLANTKKLSLNGAKILLYAGWDNSGIFERTGIAGFTPYQTKFGNIHKYQNTQESAYYGLIYMGAVSAYIPSYSDLTKPSILLSCTPLTASNSIGKHLVLNGTLNFIEMGKWLNAFMNKSVTILFDSNLKTFEIKNPCILSANNLNQAMDRLRKIGIGSYRTKTNQIKLFKAEQKQSLDDDLKGVNAYTIGTTSVKRKEIFATQIIGIPRLENAVTLQITIALNYNFNMGDKVLLNTKDIYKFALQNTNFANIITIIETNGLQGGNFVVIGVEHNGNFRSIDPTQWATKLTLIRG